MIMFVSCTATIQFDIASRSLLSKIRQFGESFASNCDKTELFYDSKRVDILPLNILPLTLSCDCVDPEKAGLVAKNELVFILCYWCWHIHILFVYCLEFKNFFVQRLFKDKTSDTVVENDIYLGEGLFCLDKDI